MDLKNIDTSNFLFNPKKDDFQERIELIPEFQYKIDKVNKKKSLIFITLMCDEHSNVRKSPIHLYQQKKQAALIAGFDLHENEDGNKKFAKMVENMIFGKVKSFNRAYIKYLSLSYNMDFVVLEILKHLHVYEMEKSFDTSSYDKDSYKRIMAISDEMEKRKNKTLGNNEIVELERLLYEEVDSRKTLPTPENVIDEYNKNGLKGWGVYGEDYTPELISFAGDKIPKK